ncbi:uncharacterized protein V1516DRAFT_679962 [Lipomyces oligophaga]|uniref:uncharacterized protein n=1 Tax=Lipomyces oligophaga TaxID=45792 RepID=UPI0034CF6F46
MLNSHERLRLGRKASPQLLNNQSYPFPLFYESFSAGSGPDPASLPIELFVNILQYLPFPTVFQCRQVSKLWKNVIESSMILWTDLDFSQNGLKLTAEVVSKAIDFSHGRAQSLILGDLSEQEQRKTELLLSSETGAKLRHLLAISITSPSEEFLRSCNLMSAFHPRIINGLTHLTIHLAHSSNLITALQQDPPRTLTHLHLDADWFEMYREFYTFQLELDTRLPSITHLHLGSDIPLEKYTYKFLTTPLFGDNKWIYLSPRGLHAVLQILPELNSLRLVRIDSYAVLEVRIFFPEIDCTHLRKLQNLEAWYCMLPKMLLPATSKNLRQVRFECSTEMPQFVNSSQSISEIPTQLETLALSDVAFPYLLNSSLVSLLSSIDSSRLTVLNISTISYTPRQINYSDHALNPHTGLVIDGVERYPGYGEEESLIQDVDTLGFRLFELCPSLKVLTLGNTVTDQALELIGRYNRLGRITIEYSPYVTRFGIFKLLKIPYDPVRVRNEFVPTAEIIRPHDHLASTIRHITIRDCPNIYAGVLDAVQDKYGIEIKVFSTTTFTYQDMHCNLDLLTNTRWLEHGYDRLVALPQLRTELFCERNNITPRPWSSHTNWM